MRPAALIQPRDTKPRYLPEGRIAIVLVVVVLLAGLGFMTARMFNLVSFGPS